MSAAWLLYLVVGGAILVAWFLCSVPVALILGWLTTRRFDEHAAAAIELGNGGRSS